MFNKLYFLALAGCAVAATASVIRHYSRREEAQQRKEDLSTWEGDGGKPAPIAALAVPAG